MTHRMNEVASPGDMADRAGQGQSQEHEHWFDDSFLQSFFSDESEAYRDPYEPGLGERVTIRLRVEKQIDVQARLLVGAHSQPIPMRREREDELFVWYEASLTCGLEAFSYRIAIDCPQGSFIYRKDGAHKVGSGAGPVVAAKAVSCMPGALGPSSAPDTPSASSAPAVLNAPSALDFRIVPGFHVPTWAQGSLQYQIFPDRFANGDCANDVVDREYAYDGMPVGKVACWSLPPLEDDYRRFYGGDLQGIIDKLDYLQGLGVEAIYLNPIFVSPSSHKYDTQDYEHVDPHFGVIVEDLKHPLPEHDLRNERARQYIKRTTSEKNLTKSNELFARLCSEIHQRGMKVILDGVFNHCGSFSKWMDREGIYKDAWNSESGAFQSSTSPYRHYFSFKDGFSSEYEGWWDYPTLPKLNYENAPDLVDRIIGIACKWAMPPYSIDGWRLDVAADLGHTERFNHAFWRRFRSDLKRENPELLIIAEHYGDVSPWLGGDQWDSVMNYDAFMDPLTFFLTGMEKHSDYARGDLYQDGEAFWGAMRTCMARFGWNSLLCAMNELSNHDHSRFLTRTNRKVGRLHTHGSAAAAEGVDKRVMREAVVVQMTWPGAPTIYYGDEAGVVGWTDPDCRRTYPWGGEDTGLVELHRALARERGRHASLRCGSFVPLGGGYGWIAFGRFTSDDRIAVVCNNADHEIDVRLRVRVLGAPDGSEIVSCFRTTKDGFDTASELLGTVLDGTCRLKIAARTALVAAIR